MCEVDFFSPSEFFYVTLLQNSSAGSNARLAYYNITAMPTVMFDGITRVVGADESYSDGTVYRGHIETRLADPAPLSITIEAFHLSPGLATALVEIELHDDLSPNSSTWLRVGVAEDDVFFQTKTFEHVLRAFGEPVALTVSEAGQTQNAVVSIPLDFEWVPSELFGFALVQDDANDQRIHNSASTHTDGNAMFIALGGPATIFGQSDPVTFDPITLLNRGMETEVLDLILHVDDLPAGWTAHMTLDGADITTATLPLDPDVQLELPVTLNPEPGDFGTVYLEVISQNSGLTIAMIELSVITGGDVLVVADDGLGYATEYYTPSIVASGRTCGVWNRSQGPVDLPALQSFEAVIWEVGGNLNALGQADRSIINSYLGTGGNLVLAGQALEAIASQYATLWIQTTLRCYYGGADSENMDVIGILGDPVGDELAFTLNDCTPDYVNLVSGQPAYPFLEYGNGRVGGLRTEYQGYKVITLGFGLENVPADERLLLVDRCLDYLIGDVVSSAEDAPRPAVNLDQNFPNPFNPATLIVFDLESSGPVRLEVFDARGWLVRTLVDDALTAGSHNRIWDGRSSDGNRVASGMYFYRLTTDSGQTQRKMTLIK